MRRQVRGQQSPSGKSVITGTNCPSKLLPLPWSLWWEFELYEFITNTNVSKTKGICYVHQWQFYQLQNSTCTLHFLLQYRNIKWVHLPAPSAFKWNALNLQNWRENIIRLNVQAFKRMGLTASTANRTKMLKDSQSSTEYLGIQRFIE